MASIIIETLTVPFEKNLLDLWKDRSPEIVPLFMLEWEGPGISNGYGFGEWMAEKYYRNKGYNVFNWIRYELTLPKTQPMICGKYTKKYGILF
jgi:hypothetical protein